MFAGSDLKDTRKQIAGYGSGGESDIAVAGRTREFLRNLEIGAKFTSVELANMMGGASVDAVSAILSKLTTKNKLSRHRRKCKGGGVGYSYTLLSHDFGMIEGRGPGTGGHLGSKRSCSAPPDPMPPEIEINDVATQHCHLPPKPTSSLSVIADKLNDLVKDLRTMSDLPLSSLLDSISIDDIFDAIRRRIK